MFFDSLLLCLFTLCGLLISFLLLHFILLFFVLLLQRFRYHQSRRLVRCLCEGGA
jgi:hypothetical protein